MLEHAFNIDNFNIIEDGSNYYFFRALNIADNSDIALGLTTNDNGDIIRIRTDLERYQGDTIYAKDDEISLKQVFDHIKMHQRKDTNCISLTSNANIAITYGRGNYKDKYIMVKIPKENICINVYNAGFYMLKELNRIVEENIANLELEDIEKYLLDFINNANSYEKIEEIKHLLPKEYVPNVDIFENGLDFNRIDTKDYNSLNKEQNLEKEKIILKVNILNRQIIPGVSNKLLIQTIGNAFSSLEYIHYQDINKDEIINITKEEMDLISIIQQLPNTFEHKNEIIKRIINELGKHELNHYSYESVSLDEKEINIDKIYELTLGRVDYKTISYLYKNIFYLAKSRLRNINTLTELKKVLNDKSKYEEVYKYIENNTYAIEPEICTKISKDLITISESLSLNITKNYYELVKKINNMSKDELLAILDNPFESIIKLLSTEIISDGITMSKTEYIANSIIDNFDWKRYGVEAKLSLLQKEDIINALIEHNFMNIYYELEKQGHSFQKITNTLFTSIIRNSNNSNSTKELSLEEIEAFIGYNKVKNLNLSLYSYQRSALENIDKILSKKDFVCAILPTGAGKSYVALAEIYERVLKNPNEKILYLAPNDEIINQMKLLIRKAYKPEEHLGDDIDKVISRLIKNIEFTTYQNLKDYKLLKVKEKLKDDYDYIIFDELHRTGAKEWKATIEELLEKQVKQVKILGITATPSRDMDMVNMADYWAYKYGYSEKEIINNNHLAANVDIIEAIQDEIIVPPKVISCLYSILNDGTLDRLNEDIESIIDVKKKNEALEEYKELRNNVEKADGIEKILCDNLKKDGKYIFFLPVNRKNDIYEDEDGNQISKMTAERMIKDYQALIKQYIYGYNYLKSHDKVIKIYTKLTNGIKIEELEKTYLEQEKENILILSRIDIANKPNSLNTKINEISDEIIRYMNWEKLNKSKLANLLTKRTEENLETYSMLGSYSSNKNFRNLTEFNKPSNNKMKLMFAMNKFNEGLHPEGITGIVWLRTLDSNSRNLYLQQLGRVIHATIPGNEVADDNKPIVIDLVNNTLKVKLEKETAEEVYIRKLINIVSMMEHNNITDISDLNSNILTVLKNIYNKYIDYVEDINKLEKLTDIKAKIRIRRIIEIASIIDLWRYPFSKDLKRTITKKRSNNEIIELFKITGIEKSFEELYEQVQKTPRYSDDILINRIHEVYERFYPGRLPGFKDSYRFFDNSRDIGQWILIERKKIEELAKSGNEKAKWIVKSKKWDQEKLDTSIQSRIKEIYERYYQSKIPTTKSQDRFLDGSARIGEWLTKSKYKVIIEEAEKGSKAARWIVEQKDLLHKKAENLVKARIKEIYERYYPSKLPHARSNDKFKDDNVKIGSFLQKYKMKIIEEAQKGNKEAIWIAEERKWIDDKTKSIIDISTKKRLQEIYERYHPNKVPTPKTQDRFLDGSAKIGKWLDNKKEIVIDEVNKGSEVAKWIAIQKAWIVDEEHNMIKTRIEEIYERYYLGKIPAPSSLDKFLDNSVRIGNWIVIHKEEITKEAQKGNKKAIWLLEEKKNLKQKTIQEIKENSIESRIDEIYKRYYPDKIPVKKSQDRFSDTNAKIGEWIVKHKEEILELAKNGNEIAKWIVEEKEMYKEKTDTSIASRSKEIYERYYPKELPTFKSPDKFLDNSAFIYGWMSVHKDKIMASANKGDAKAKWIAEKRGWITKEVNKEELIDNYLKQLESNVYIELDNEVKKTR